jgi:NAD(P)-dependent dehydrogenase (short-subunit alcohol dehydrogenase family)
MATGALTGRVAIVTGAGRGLGRAHALALAADGAAVVVNDLGGDLHGHGADPTPAQSVVAEIEAAGGQAMVSGHDVSDWAQAGEMVQAALTAFGRLDVLVNNAGILRDRLFANMSEGDWDAVIRVHLKGHAAPSHHAMVHWRSQAKAGQTVQASVIHTTSVAGFIGNFGQANYSAAKMGIVGFALTLANEGAKYGVRSNAVSPSARTRIEESLKPPPPGVFDVFDPANVSPLIAWLARADCPATGQVFHTYGDRIEVIAPASVVADLRNGGQWTPDHIAQALAGRLPDVPKLTDFVPEAR